MWSASRNDCFPLSRLWKQVHPRFGMPLNAACASGTFVTVRFLPKFERRVLISVGLRIDIPWIFCSFLFHGEFVVACAR